MEPSLPSGDSCCPVCGSLLWWFRDHYSDASIQLDSSFKDVDPGSLETIELVMELENEFNINIPDEDAAKIFTVQDAIRYIRRHRSKAI